jgi:hypothetical protein
MAGDRRQQNGVGISWPNKVIRVSILQTSIITRGRKHWAACASRLRRKVISSPDPLAKYSHAACDIFRFASIS